uniref:Uncharacterized protein n=1 Tax=Vitis vinifera TaxID=29760 RepID=A5APR6_VITVI|nr:hypothetical protein VITISV_019170 [Vitis vinifera]
MLSTLKSLCFLHAFSHKPGFLQDVHPLDPTFVTPREKKQYRCAKGLHPRGSFVSASLRWTRGRPSCDTWHHSFHSDGNSHSFHPECLTSGFMSGRHPTSSGCLTVAILSGRRSTSSGYLTSESADVPPSLDISQPVPAAGWERRTIQLPRSGMSGYSDSAYPENIRSRHFRFPEQLSSSNTRDSPDPFPPTIKNQTQIILTTKSPELSLIFNER